MPNLIHSLDAANIHLLFNEIKEQHIYTLKTIENLKKNTGEYNPYI